MKTKRDFWRLVGLSYLLIFSGIILLYIIEENNPFEIYLLIGVIVLEFSGLITIVKALKIFRSLDDKSVYRKQFGQWYLHVCSFQ